MLALIALVMSGCNSGTAPQSITNSDGTTEEVKLSEPTTSKEITPEATTPEGTTPEITTPEGTTPEITSPEGSHVHTEVVDPAQKPTCTETGLTQGSHCAGCHEILVEQEVIGASGHNYTSTVTPPTATENGYKTYNCSACGDTGNEAIVPVNLTITAENRFIVGYIGEEGENLVIPDVFEYDGIWCRVVRIGYEAFYDCTGLASVAIPNSVTAIDMEAFSCCTGLTSVIIPNSVTSINDGAFAGCTRLTRITLSSGLTNIGDCVVAGCTELTSIIVAEGNTKYHVAGNCLIETARKKLVLGCKNSVIPTDGSVTIIGEDAFSNCVGLTSITIPDSVTSIGKGTFSSCIGLTNITISNSLTYIGSGAFSNCTGLTSITLPDSVKSVSYDAFYGCSGLTSITVEEGNTTYHAAGNCLIETESKALVLGCNNSVIPADGSVTIIDFAAFRGCAGLTSVVIPDSVTSIGRYAFSYCSGLTSITIPNSVTSIDLAAFSGCIGLTSITIPDRVYSIGDNAFSGCSGLTSITVEDGNTNYHAVGNCLIETDSKTLILGCKNSTIPTDGRVLIIGGNAFDGCVGLTSITIPNSVEQIDSYAFSECTGLTNIVFEGTVAQWNAIKKKFAWDSNAGRYSISCTDGIIAEGGTVTYY